MHPPSPDSKAIPRLTAVVVHWRNEAQLAELLRAWPMDDPRFELLVIDNSASLPELASPVRKIVPPHNLGFAGGVNCGLALAQGEFLLLLNPDVRPLPGALPALLQGFVDFPDAAGLAPALLDPDGVSQCRWQLRPLPSPWTLLRQTLLLRGTAGPATEPLAGALVAQPAGAALVLQRRVLSALGGLDTGFFPAWFEDVDLARRLQRAGHCLRYCPTSRWLHVGGATVPQLGYGPFLWIYNRNLTRYLGCHHGGLWVGLARTTLFGGMLLRLLSLPLRRPRRATSRLAAARGLLAVMAGTLSHWRRPRSYAQLCVPAGNEGSMQ